MHCARDMLSSMSPSLLTGVEAGAGAARPTYFELFAASRLMPGLKMALLYSLAVRPQPWDAARQLRGLSSSTGCLARRRETGT